MSRQTTGAALVDELDAQQRLADDGARADAELVEPRRERLESGSFRLAR